MVYTAVVHENSEAHEIDIICYCYQKNMDQKDFLSLLGLSKWEHHTAVKYPKISTQVLWFRCFAFSQVEETLQKQFFDKRRVFSHVTKRRIPPQHLGKWREQLCTAQQ